MKSLVTVFATLSLLGVAACGGGDDNPPQPDVNNTPIPDANNTGTPDASGPGTPDAMPNPGLSADHLGALCGGENPACPTGYQCLVTSAGATTGFCSLPCEGNTDMVTCSAANGFPGPGDGQCTFTVGDPPEPYCGIRCGTQWMPALPTDCPTGLTCIDLTGPAGTPDGMTDFCAIPG